MAQPGCRRDRVQSPLVAQDRWQQNGWCREQAQGGFNILTILDTCDQRAHPVHRRQGENTGIHVLNQRERIGPRPAKMARKGAFVRQVVEQACEEKPGHCLERFLTGNLVQRVALDDEGALRTVDCGQARFSGDDIFQTHAHG